MGRAGCSFQRWTGEQESVADKSMLPDFLNPRYDMVADRWSVETNVPTPRFHAGVTRVGGTIFIIGGFLDDDMFDRATGVTGSEDQWNDY